MRMNPGIITWTFFLLWAADVSQSVLITQWPQIISRHPNGSAEMHCYQNETDYSYLYWYRQLRGQSFQLMVMVSAGSATFEEDFKSGYQAVRQKKEEKQWSLSIESVQRKDEAVYLCAASLHGAVAHLRPVTRTYCREALCCSDTCQACAVTFVKFDPQIVQKDIAVEIKCSHNDTSLVIMLWYQQRKGSTSLTLIGYGSESSPTYEDRATSVAFQPSHPKVVVEKARVEFNCSHNDENLDVMLWYQQTQSGMMDLIGYGYTSSEPDYEEKFKDRWKTFITNMFIIVLSLFLLLHSGLSVVVNQSGTQTSQPGLTADFRCSLEFSMSSYTMLWYRQAHHGAAVEFLIKEHDQPQGRFEATINIFKNIFTLKVTDLILSDSSTYFCAARHKKLSANTVCRSNLQRDTRSKVSVSSELFDVKIQHCVNNEAYFGPGTKLTVLEEGLKVTPPTVRVLPASPKECGHQSKTIVCVASGFYPDHVSFSWTDKEGEVSSGVATDSEAVLEEGKTYMMSSRLRVSAEEWNNPDNEFTCTVHFFDGDKTVPYSASVKGIEAERKTITRDKYLKVTQSAKLTYSVFIVKSCFYGAFVAFLLLKFQGAKQKN
nr:uncharacterized protein LOC110002957 [Labrus bergylta]